MDHKQVRVLHVKSGQHTFIEPHIAADTKLLYDYGYIVQDLPAKEEIVKVEEIKKDPEPLDLLSVEQPLGEVKTPKTRVKK